jgi:hypothetical protein
MAHLENSARCGVSRKGAHVGICALRSHPRSGEAIITIDDEWHRGEAGSDGTALFHLALDWKQQFVAKDWRGDVSIAAAEKKTPPLVEAFIRQVIEGHHMNDLDAGLSRGCHFATTTLLSVLLGGVSTVLF